MLRHNAIGFGSFNQKTLREFFQRIRELIPSRLFLCPGADLIDPFPLICTVKFTSVDPGIFDDRLNLADRRIPLLLDGRNFGGNFFMARSESFICWRRRFDYRCFTLKIAIDGTQKLLGALP